MWGLFLKEKSSQARRLETEMTIVLSSTLAVTRIYETVIYLKSSSYVMHVPAISRQGGAVGLIVAEDDHVGGLETKGS